MSDIVILPPFEWEGAETKYSIIESVHLIPRKLIQMYLKQKDKFSLKIHTNTEVNFSSSSSYFPLLKGKGLRLNTQLSRAFT